MSTATEPPRTVASIPDGFRVQSAPDAPTVEPCDGTGLPACPGCPACAPLTGAEFSARLATFRGIADLRARREAADQLAAVTPKPIAGAPYGVRMLVFWHGEWHIASVSEDCPGCTGKSCPYCFGVSGDTWRDANGDIHEGMDEDPPTVYLPLPPAPVPA